MTPALYRVIEPYVTALPTTTLINVQTASAPVLVTIGPTLSLTVAKTLQQVRAEHPIVSPQMFSALDVIKNHNIPTEKITTTSNYFLLKTDVAIEAQHVLLYTLLERTINDGKVACRVLWQSKSVSG
jgi:general secretion pathway protein K